MRKKIVRLWNKLMDILPVLWGALWVLIISLVSVGILIWSVKWLLTLVGVM